jgi:cyclopropane fatty-acyl-phospholipid synthase-like methyltransferase
MENLQSYLKHYKDQFELEHPLMAVDGDGGHVHHNPDPDYWAILLGDVKFNAERWKGKRAFDFGCGCGRNLYNLSTLADWDTIDGCDISKSNAAYSKQWFDKSNKTDAKCVTWENNGKDIQPTPYNYDFIMSHIVFQHISNYDVRYSIMEDMYNSLNEGGLCSLHFMDLGTYERKDTVSYFENSLQYNNCRVDNEQYLVDDFNKIGFKNVSVQTGRDYLTGVKAYYIKGTK